MQSSVSKKYLSSSSSSSSTRSLNLMPGPWTLAAPAILAAYHWICQRKETASRPQSRLPHPLQTEHLTMHTRGPLLLLCALTYGEDRIKDGRGG